MSQITPIDLLILIKRFPKCCIAPERLLASVALTWHQKCRGMDAETVVKYGITYDGD